MKDRICKITKLCFAIGILFLFPVVIFQDTKTAEPTEYMKTGGEIVVIFDKEINDDVLYTLTSSFDTPVKVVRHIGDYALLFVQDGEKYNYVLKTLKGSPQVQAVQANNDITSLGFSNDTYADTQWAINNPGHYIYLSKAGSREKKAIEDVDMDVVEAWEQFGREEHEKREVIVAIIDTGVDYSHPDLAEHMWINEDEIPGDNIDNDGNGYIDDIYGWDFYNEDASICHYKFSTEYNAELADPEDNDDHGTHIAGIIGAVANNGIGIAGVASNIDIKIMSLKINGGEKGTGSVAGAIEAIKYATMMGADICNLSWGTDQYADALELIMKESDMLFVAAAGNSGTDNNNTPVYPASLKLDNLISVTFIDPAGELASQSNYGNSSVDLAAPGEDIFSTVVGSYGSMSGSSMAAPQVSAVAAMLYAYGEYIYPKNVKEIILNNIKTYPDLEGNLIYPGIPSAYLAVLASGSLVEDTEPPKMTFETIFNKSSMQIPIYTKDQGGSDIRVIRYIIGEKTLDEFCRGTEGTAVTDQMIEVSKGGNYTFYAADYAGNETIATYEVVEDTKAPKLTISYTVADNYKSRTVSVRVSDSQSGIRRVKYMAGVQAAADFLPANAGTELILKDGKVTFKATKDGIYTIFASDNRGNNIVKQIEVKTVKVTEIKFTRAKVTLYKGDQFTLTTFVKPAGTTDQIIYSSSDKAVATVSNKGKITALKEGKAYITARTSSGKTAVCEVTVIKEITLSE